MENLNSKCGPGSTGPAGSSPKLTDWSRRLAAEAERTLRGNLPGLVRDWIASDPAARKCLEGVLVDAQTRLITQFANTLARLTEIATEEGRTRLEGRLVRSRREMARNAVRELSIVRRWTRARSLVVWLALLFAAASAFPALILFWPWDKPRPGTIFEQLSEDNASLLRSLVTANRKASETAAELEKLRTQTKILERIQVREMANGQMQVLIQIPNNEAFRRAGLAKMEFWMVATKREKQ